MIKSKLDAIKKGLSFIFSKDHWYKTLILLAVMFIGFILSTKDCSIKTKKVDIHTDTHLDAAKDKVDKAPKDYPRGPEERR